MAARVIAFILLSLIPARLPGVQRAATDPRLLPHRIALANGRSFNLSLPEGFAIRVAAQGLKRVRFMATSSDGRIFVTDMDTLADNTRGIVYVLDGFDSATGRFSQTTPYLTKLRNPNSLAFYRDRAGVEWLYLALTDRLVRYRYRAGDNAPGTQPEVLATFPDYGLSYKYGGWHLTRTIAIGSNGKLYVSVGSSCNACEEKEDVRASVIEMDPDGKNPRRFAFGLRNAVGVRWIRDRLIVTNQGSDHLGDQKPAETMYAISEGTNYGWPYCYQSGTSRLEDPAFNPGGRHLDCGRVPVAFASFGAHSSPLGFEFFDETSASQLRDSYLVALHGSSKTALGRGYRVVRLQASRAPADAPVDFITGFLTAGKVNGRPVDILKFAGGFLLTDDFAGVVYYIHKP